MGKSIDKTFLWIVVFLLMMGIFIFSSASLGLIARDGIKFSGIATNQILFGILFGVIAMAITSKINYKFWKRYSFYIFFASIIITLLVFVPGIGYEHGGAIRWIKLGPLSFQPAELLKLGFVIYLSAWLSAAKDKVSQFRYGPLPFLIMLGLAGLILINQPDTGTFAVIMASGLAILIASGAKWKHIFGIIGIAIVGLILLAIFKPYVKDRLMTFLDPTNDPQGSSYQIRQSLIAIGSGETFGRGFGQSIQKFKYLPEPVGDSIFAVAAEEFGFAGSMVIIAAFLAFAIRGLKISANAPDGFGGLITVGIVILVVSQSFTNIASMLGVFPLTGLPLLFISQGGTAMLVTLAEIGIILNISRYTR